MLSSDDFTKLCTYNLCFMGVYPQDRLPNVKHATRPWCLVINSDTHTLPGKHWIAVYAPPHGCGIYFIDPLTLPMNKYSYILNWLSHNYIVTLPYRIQPLNSIWCGAYCMYILKQLPNHNHNLFHVIEKYFVANDLKVNDIMISNWFNKFAQ